MKSTLIYLLILLDPAGVPGVGYLIYLIYSNDRRYDLLT